MSAHAFGNWLTEYLVNALWQVPLVWLGATVAARLARRLDVRMSHALWVAGLVSAVVVPAVSLDGLGELWPGGGESGASGHVQVTLRPARLADGGLLLPHAWQVILLAALVLGAVVACVRLARGMRQVVLLRTGSRVLELPEGVAVRWRSLCGLFAVEGVQLRESQAVAGPLVTAGSTLLLPAGFCATASAEELEAALAHELAHVRRRDVRKSFCYALVALPIAWHPCAWMIRRGLDDSREMVCDAMAADALQGETAYARTLLRIAARMPAALCSGPVAAVGMFRRSSIEGRITMLMQRKQHVRTTVRAALFAATLAVGAATGAALTETHLDVHAAVAAAAPKRIAVSSGIMAGQVVSRVQPTYPAAAKKAHIEGSVVLAATISKTGAVTKLRRLSGPPELVASAIEAVQQWQYKPYLLNGDPVAVDTTITVTYTLQK